MSNKSDFKKIVLSENNNFYNLLFKIHDVSFYKKYFDINLKEDGVNQLISKLLENNNNFKNDLLNNIYDDVEDMCTSIYSINWNYNQHDSYSYKSYFYIFKLEQFYVLISIKYYSWGDGYENKIILTKNIEESISFIDEDLDFLINIEIPNSIQLEKENIEDYNNNYSFELKWNVDLISYLFKEELISNDEMLYYTNINKQIISRNK